MLRIMKSDGRLNVVLVKSLKKNTKKLEKFQHLKFENIFPSQWHNFQFSLVFEIFSQSYIIKSKEKSYKRMLIEEKIFRRVLPRLQLWNERKKLKNKKKKLWFWIP